MTSVLRRNPADTAQTTAVIGRRPLIAGTRTVFLLCLLGYLAVAGWFWRAELIPGDAASRVANAYYTVFSRDPHLAAVGFVWNPLPSLVLLPALPLKAVFPALTRDALLAPISSALFMAATVATAYDMLGRLGVRRLPHGLLTAALATHPMVLIYAGNGMSEACFLFFLVAAVRGLLRWLVESKVERLTTVGICLGFAYASRYEALAPGVVVPGVAALYSWWRYTGGSARRWATARTDAVLVGLPMLLAVAGWAVASKIIVGQWFATFSSQYGNSAQVAAAISGIEQVTGHTFLRRVGYGLHQALGLAPTLPLLLIVAAVVGVRRRDPRLFAPVAVLLPVVAFDNGTLVTGASFGWLRFQIAVIPLAVLLAGVLLAAPTAPWRAGSTSTPPIDLVPVAADPVPGSTDAVSVPANAPGGRAHSASVRARLAAAGVLIAALLAQPAAVATLSTPSLAREESEWLTAAGARRTAGLARVSARVAADLDAMALPHGAVITDSAYAFAIILASRNPKQFVITSDRDFAEILVDPARHGVRYLLLSEQGAADAVRIAHPQAASAAVRTWADEQGSSQWLLVAVDRL